MPQTSAPGSGAVGAQAAPNTRQPATTSQDTSATTQEALERRVAELEALLTQANILPTPGDNPTVPRPRKIINIRVQMGLNSATDKDKYNHMLRGIRKIADQANFDCTIDWRHQPKDKVSRAFAVARKRFPYLRRFENDWAVNHFLRQYCKNRRAYDKVTAASEELDLEEGMDTS